MITEKEYLYNKINSIRNHDWVFVGKLEWLCSTHEFTYAPTGLFDSEDYLWVRQYNLEEFLDDSITKKLSNEAINDRRGTMYCIGSDPENGQRFKINRVLEVSEILLGILNEVSSTCTGIRLAGTIYWITAEDITAEYWKNNKL